MVQRKFNTNIKQINVPICDLKSKPDLNANLETQLLYGEKVKIINEINNKWLLCKSIEDCYKGYLRKENLDNETTLNFQVSSLSCFVYEKPNIKSKVISQLFLNSKVFVLEEQNEWVKVLFQNEMAYIYKKSLRTIKDKPNYSISWVNIALNFLNTPYLWGGKSHLGIDCSGFVQLSLGSYNISLPRNSKDQLNSKLLISSSEDNIKKGTLIFWEGHVAIAINAKEIIHANAFHMKVAKEKFIHAKNRIKNSYGEILEYKIFKRDVYEKNN